MHGRNALLCPDPQIGRIGFFSQGFSGPWQVRASLVAVLEIDQERRKASLLVGQVRVLALQVGDAGG